jgi:16S rRNA (cytidine1402-2'-O)-methyltransferase
MENEIEKGVLYVVATPIGNLRDVTHRAVHILSAVDRVAVEDTRHSAKLFQHYQITTPTMALHEHNERQVAHSIIEKIKAGETWALISDAGTPVISDPGYYLIKAAQEQGVKVSPIPGASAAIAALSVSGMPSDHFSFEGFLPSKSAARQTHLEKLGRETRTMIFYEAPHRICDTLRDMAVAFGEKREALVARELTKAYETVRRDVLGRLAQWVVDDANQQRGEFVVVVSGGEPTADNQTVEGERVLNILLNELPVNQAAKLAARITGAHKNALYEKALQWKQK